MFIVFSQYLVLAEQEGQQHQHASIMDYPPHVNVTLSEALTIGRECRDVLRDEKSQFGSSRFSDQLCREEKMHQEMGVLAVLHLSLLQKLFTCCGQLWIYYHFKVCLWLTSKQSSDTFMG